MGLRKLFVQAKLSDLLEHLRLATQENAGETICSEKSTNEKKQKSKSQIPKEEKDFLKLPDLPFSSNIYIYGSEGYLRAKKALIDFIETHQKHSVWCSLFQIVWERLTKVQYLPSLEELNLLFSIMDSRENTSTLKSDLEAKGLSNWVSRVLLGNIREKLHHFVLSKSTDDNLFDELNLKITKLSHQPNVLNIFYQKLASQTTLFDPRFAVSTEELNEILSAFEPLKEKSYDDVFLNALNQTPFSSWDKAIRERYLQQLLFDSAWPKPMDKDQKRCLLSLRKLEENLGRQIIDRLVSFMQKKEKSVDYAQLADILMLVSYQQLTLDNASLSLLEHAAFEKWSDILLDFHKKEAEKPRDLPILLSLMQKVASNTKIEMLYPKDGNPPLIMQQIQEIQAYLHGAKSPKLTHLIFQTQEKDSIYCVKSIDDWNEKDILEWSNAFRKQTGTRKLVEEHLCEIVAIISQAVFLEKGFYPRDVQYLALLTAFVGSNHAQKMISQIATGQGKTITGTMLAILKVLAGERVDFVTSSSVLAEETEEEIRSVTRIFGFTSACNTECNYGPYALELIEGEPSEAQIEQLCKNRGIAIIKKGEEYFLGFSRKLDSVFIESLLDLSEWPDFQKKITEPPFQSRKSTLKDGLHEVVFKIIQKAELQECISPAQDAISKLQENYRADILCGDLQSFIYAYLLTLFYGKNITQNRIAFMIMDEVDRLLDTIQDILYLSHHIPDMHHLNNLLFAIWQGVNCPSFEGTDENIANLRQDILDQISFGDRSTTEELEGKILVPKHLEEFVRRRLSTWIKSGKIALRDLSKDNEYVVAQVREGEERGVYPVDQDTGVTALNKELANGADFFLNIKHQKWPKPLSLKAISFCDPISFLMETYKNGFFGMSGTLGSEQDYRFFEKLFDINKKCIIPRHELLDLEIDPPIFVSSFNEQMEAAAKEMQKLRALGHPVEIMCNSIADAKALTEFLKKRTPDAPIYTRIYSFKPFTKGSKKDPILPGDVIITTPFSGRGTNLLLSPKARLKKLCLIKFSIYKNERTDKQVDGRTAREDLPGRLIHILCPQHGESSLEEMHAIRDLLEEQAQDQIKKVDLHLNYINRQLFEAFIKLLEEVEKILRNTEPGKWPGAEGFVEKQMAAFKTRCAFWLDEIEQKMEETGIPDVDALHADFQIFRNKMLALAQEEGIVKFVVGAGELTQLGTWFGQEKKYSSEAIACHDQVIQDFYLFSGPAFYRKAITLLDSEDDFRTRKKAAYCLKQAKILLQKEIERLQEPVDRMIALDAVLRKNGQGLQDSQFKKTIIGLVNAFMVHINMIDHIIGRIPDPSFFQSAIVDKTKAEILITKLIRKGDIEGYHVNKNILITDDKRLVRVLPNDEKQEIKFPSELNDYQEKIINFFTHQEGNLKSNRVTYKQFCKLVFDEEEATAEATKTIAMELSWKFLQQENAICKPTDKEITEALFKRSVKKGRIKGYRINKKAFVTADKRLEILLPNSKRQEIKFPSELTNFQEKIINVIFDHQGNDLKLNTLSYEQYCKVVFDEEETTAEETKKMAMKLSWYFLQKENVICQPSFAGSRWRKLRLDPNDRSNTFPMPLKALAAGFLRTLGRNEIEMHTDSIQNLAERGRIPMEVLAFFKHSLEFDQVIRIEKKPIRWNTDATFILFCVGLQMLVGILFCPLLLEQAKNDLLFLAVSILSGEISIENYFRYKRVAIATVALTKGVLLAANWIIRSADKVLLNTTQIVNKANLNNNFLKTIANTSTNILQTGHSALSLTHKIVNCVPTPALVRHTDMSYSSQLVGTLKQVSAQIATLMTMEYLVTTFCPDDLDRNLRKTIGDRLQIEVDPIAQEIKELCIRMLECCESLDEAEQIVRSLFETTLREYQHERYDPLKINMSLFSTQELGNVFANEIFTQTGSGFLAGLTKQAIIQLEKVDAISEAFVGLKSIMKQVFGNAFFKLNDLQLIRHSNPQLFRQVKRTEKEKVDFAKFVDEELQRFRSKAGNEFLSRLGNIVLKPVALCMWESAFDFVCKKSAKNIEMVNQEDTANKNEDSVPSPTLKEKNASFPKKLSQVRIVNTANLKEIAEIEQIEHPSEERTTVKLVEDQQGNQYFLETSKNPEHLLSKYATNQAYAALGIPVPEVMLYDLKTGKQITKHENIDNFAMLSKCIKGTQDLWFVLEESEKMIDKNQAKNIVKPGFVADCLLANPGLNFGKIRIDMEKEIAWRVDCGAALDYQSIGEKKVKEEVLTPIIKEFETFRGSKGDSVFETLTDEDIVKQIEDILPHRKSFLATIPNHLKEVMAQRFDYLSVYKEKLTSPDRLLHAVWQGKEISGKELFNTTKTLQSKWSKQAKKDNTLLTTLSQLYEIAAEKFITEGNIEKAFKIRSFSAQAISMPKTHPLYKMHDAIDKETKKQSDPFFGAFFSHLGGSGDLKLGHMHVANRRFTNGKKAHCFEFKITYPSRVKLKKTLKLISENQDLFKTSLPKDLRNLSVDTGLHYFKGKSKKGNFYNGSEKGFKIGKNVKNGSAWKINIPDILEVTIGKKPKLGCLYNNISVELNSKLPNEKKLEVFHQLFTMLGFGAIVSPKRPEDEERVKIAQLYRTFYPREALKIERTSKFYEMPIEELKHQIVRSVPDMESIFNKYLVESPHLLKEDSIYPGKNVWSVSDLSNQMREKGAYGLYATISASYIYDDLSKNTEAIVSILEKGALSTQDRLEAGIFIRGYGRKTDLKTGGGGHVFTRLSTKNTQDDFSILCQDGNMVMLFNLDAVNQGGYGYDIEHLGSKNPKSNYYYAYEKRSNLIDLAKNLSEKDFYNEIMIKNRIPPKYIKGIVVEHEKFKEDLKIALTNAGINSFNGKKLDDFILVAKNEPAQKELWE